MGARRKKAGARSVVRRKAARAPAVRVPAAREAAGADPILRTTRARELFWANVVREIFTSLWAASTRATAGEGERAGAASAGGEGTPAGPDPASLLDGRFSVVTNTGLRVPIAEVQPVFGCGIPDKGGHEDWLSEAVECTVFQIRTPSGEVFTLPIQAVRAFHSQSDESMQRLEHAGREVGDKEPERPFGFAAFTSLSRSASRTVDETTVDPRWFHESE